MADESVISNGKSLKEICEDYNNQMRHLLAQFIEIARSIDLEKASDQRSRNEDAEVEAEAENHHESFNAKPIPIIVTESESDSSNVDSGSNEQELITEYLHGTIVDKIQQISESSMEEKDRIKHNQSDTRIEEAILVALVNLVTDFDDKQEKNCGLNFQKLQSKSIQVELQIFNGDGANIDESLEAEFLSMNTSKGFTAYSGYVDSEKLGFETLDYEDFVGILPKLENGGFVIEYIEQFEILPSQVKMSTESILVNIFVSGLRPQIHSKLLLAKPVIVRLATELALIHDDQNFYWDPGGILKVVTTNIEFRGTFMWFDEVTEDFESNMTLFASEAGHKKLRMVSQEEVFKSGTSCEDFSDHSHASFLFLAGLCAAICSIPDKRDGIACMTNGKASFVDELGDISQNQTQVDVMHIGCGDGGNILLEPTVDKK